MVAFEFFGISIYRYGIFYALAFSLGYLGLYFIGKKGRLKSFPTIQHILTQGLEDLLLTIALGVLVGGRLGHILIYANGYYFTHRTESFKIREGGMSFIGGIFGVVITISIITLIKKLTRKDFLILFDLILIFVPLGIFFGRFGNFLNQELYGIPVSQLPSQLGNLLSFLHLTHIYPAIDQIPRVNTNFLAMIFEGALLFILQIFTFFQQIKQKKRKIGLLSTNFLLGYSLIRFFLEYLRADSQLEIIHHLSKSQRFFLTFIAIALIIKYLLYKYRYTHDLNKPKI